jgi:hypothetical protein
MAGAAGIHVLFTVHMKTLAKIAVLIMVGIATAVLWLYCSVFLPHELAYGGRSLAIAQRIAGIVTVLALFVAPALPIRSIFPGRPVAAAAAIGWMPLALAISADAGTQGIASAALEGGVAWLAIVLGAWIAGRLPKDA